jgi:hypothetical protein
MLFFEETTGLSSTRKPNRLIIVFGDDEYVKGEPKVIFFISIVSTMANHDVSRIMWTREAYVTLSMRSC